MPPARIREVGTDGITFETATPASQPGDVFPSGVILQFAGAAAPTNWIICDGSAVSRTTYATLFAAIGTVYGSGDGSTTFNLPDLRDKVPVGKSASKALGSTGGAETHTLSVSEMPSHNHNGVTQVNSTGISVQQDGIHSHPFLAWSGGGAGIIRLLKGEPDGGSPTSIAGTNSISNSASHAHGITDPSHAHVITAQGGGAAHSVMQPYIALNHIIKT